MSPEVQQFVSANWLPRESTLVCPCGRSIAPAERLNPPFGLCQLCKSIVLSLDVQ